MMKPSEVKQSIDQKLLSLLVASVRNYAIFMVGPNGYITSWNNGAERIKGYSENEIEKEKDIITSYDLGVNSYVVKPINIKGFVKAVSQLGLFRLITNRTSQKSPK